MSSRWPAALTGIMPSTAVLGRPIDFKVTCFGTSVMLLAAEAFDDGAQAMVCLNLQFLRKHLSYILCQQLPRKVTDFAAHPLKIQTDARGQDLCRYFFWGFDKEVLQFVGARRIEDL